MTPDISHWRYSKRYEYVESLVSPDLAWEWLRRNEDYQRDFIAIQTDPDIENATIEAITSRWGLRFPSFAGARCQTSSAHLGSYGEYRRCLIDQPARSASARR